MKKVIGICSLCHEEKRLCQSHIYPESFYKHIYAAKAHKFITLSTDVTKAIDLEQCGIREYLMCKECDQGIIGKYDDFIAHWLYYDTIMRPESFKYSQRFQGVDYSLMRLFQLSLLWRFHVVKGHGFKAIDLGNEAETIRKMLLAGDPGNPAYFPCIMIIPKNLFNILSGGILCPVLAGTDQFPICRTIVVGIVWMWIMVPNATSHPFSELAVSPAGYMHLVNGTDEISEAIIRDFVELNRASAQQPNADKLGKWGFAQRDQ